MQLSKMERLIRNIGMVFWAAAIVLMLTEWDLGIENLEYLLGALGFLVYGAAFLKKDRTYAFKWILLGIVAAVVLVVMMLR